MFFLDSISLTATLGSGYDEEADNGPKTWLEKFKARN